MLRLGRTVPLMAAKYVAVEAISLGHTYHMLHIGHARYLGYKLEWAYAAS